MTVFFKFLAIFLWHLEQLSQLETVAVVSRCVCSGACAAECTRDGGNGSPIATDGSLPLKTDFQAERQQAREETKREAFVFFSRSFGTVKLWQLTGSRA